MSTTSDDFLFDPYFFNLPIHISAGSGQTPCYFASISASQNEV